MWITEDDRKKHYNKNQGLKLAQKMGQYRYITANVNTDYKIREEEKGFYHIKQVRRVHDSKTKQYIEQPTIAKYRPKVFEQTLIKNVRGKRLEIKPMEKSLTETYDSVEIIHNPKLPLIEEIKETQAQLPESEVVKQIEPNKPLKVGVVSGDVIPDVPNIESGRLYTYEELDDMKIGELRVIADPLGIKGISKKKLIEDILQTQ